MVGVEWFNYHRVADFSGGIDRSIFGTEHDLLRHRQTHILEQAMGAFLVARERGRYSAGIASYRGLDTFLVLAVTKLHQAVFV